MDLVAPLTRGAKWLVRFSDAHGKTLDLQGTSLVALALACALKALPADSSLTLRTASDAVLDRLATLTATDDGAADFDQGAFLIALMAAAATVGVASEDDPFRSFCVRRWAQRRQADATMGTDARAADALWRLLRGEPPMTAADDGFEGNVLTPDAPYRLNSDAILALTTSLHMRSIYGRMPPSLSPPEDEALREALPFWTFYFVKKRDLDVVGPLVRSLAYGGLRGAAEFGEGVEFVVRQQQPDGRFGRHDLESHRLALTLGSDFDMDRHLYLALTASSLWTLAVAQPMAQPLFGDA